METLLGLTLALFVAVRSYQRADAGTLDGDEHHNVARALASGTSRISSYPRLRLAEQDNEQLYAPRRTVLVVRHRREPITTGEWPTAPFVFDAPTALFTVQDFYAALNRRRLDDGAEPLSQQSVLHYPNQQIGPKPAGPPRAARWPRPPYR
jgi:hypothetical protein